jgi:hypothetical protein
VRFVAKISGQIQLNVKICSYSEVHRSDLASIVKRHFHDVNQYVARCFEGYGLMLVDVTYRLWTNL